MYCTRVLYSPDEGRWGGGLGDGGLHGGGGGGVLLGLETLVSVMLGDVLHHVNLGLVTNVITVLRVLTNERRVNNVIDQ